jgi:hypothetical protein
MPSPKKNRTHTVIHVYTLSTGRLRQEDRLGPGVQGHPGPHSKIPFQNRQTLRIHTDQSIFRHSTWDLSSPAGDIWSQAALVGVSCYCNKTTQAGYFIKQRGSCDSGSRGWIRRLLRQGPLLHHNMVEKQKETVVGRGSHVQARKREAGEGPGPLCLNHLFLLWHWGSKLGLLGAHVGCIRFQSESSRLTVSVW